MRSLMSTWCIYRTAYGTGVAVHFIPPAVFWIKFPRIWARARARNRGRARATASNSISYARTENTHRRHAQAIVGGAGGGTKVLGAP